MKPLLPSIRHYGVTVLTLGIVVTIFLYYFLVYVEQNKNYLHERAFRVLVQNKINLDQKVKTIRINAAQEVRHRIINDPVRDVLIMKKARLPERGIYNHSIVFNKIRTIQKKPDPTPKKTNSIKSPFSIQYDLAGNVGQLLFEDTVSARWVNKKKQKDFKINYSVDLSEFVSTALIGQQEVFDEYVVLKDLATIYESSPIGFKIEKADSLFHGRKGGGKRNIFDLELGGMPYKVFVQDVNIGHDSHLKLCGLIREANYRSQVYSVSVLTLILSLLGALLLALGYPFIKLFIMSQGERLKVSDSLFSVFSVIAGSFIVTLLLLSGYVYLGPDAVKRDDNLKALADSIQTNFRKELTDVHHQLIAYKSYINQHRSDFDSTEGWQVNVLDTSSSLKPYMPYPATYPFFKDVFWIDSSGFTREVWTIGSINSPQVDVEDRRYYRMVMDGQAWRPDSIFEAIGLESIFNRISGENIVDIAAPFDSINQNTGTNAKNQRPVFVMETRLTSVIDPLLPVGFGFCIMDRKGQVWFHSDAKKNLQENFLKECSENRHLQAALHGNTSLPLDLTYNGNSYRSYITPFLHMPLYLVVFHTDDYQKSVGSMTISISIIYYMLAFLPLLLFLLVHKALHPGDLRLKGQHFAFSWLSPRYANHRHYQHLLFFNLLLALSNLIVLGIYKTDLGLLVFFTLTILFSFAAARFQLYQHLNLAKRVTFWGLLSLLVFFCLWLVIQNKDTNFDWPYFDWPVLLSMIALILLSIAYAYLITSSKLLAQWSQAGKVKLEAWLTGQTVTDWAWSARARYIYWMCSWIVILAIMPAVGLYKISYDHEQKIVAADFLIHFADDFSSRKERINKEYRAIKRSNDSIINRLIENRGIYSFDSTSPVCICTAENTKQSDCKDSIVQAAFFPLSQLRPLFNLLVAENNYLLSPDSTQGNWKWIATKSEELHLHYKAYDLSNPDRNFLSLKRSFTPLNGSMLIGQGSPNSWLLVIFILLIIVLALVGLYAAIRYLVHHLFSFGLYESALGDYPKKIGLQGIKNVVFDKKKRLLLSGPFLPDNENALTEAWGKDIHLVDILKIKNNLLALGPREKGKVLVITHFEEIAKWHPQEKFSDLIINQILQTEETAGTLIISNREPSDIRKKLYKYIDELKKLEKDADQPSVLHSQRLQAMYEVNRWETVLSRFYEGYFHLNTFSPSKEGKGVANGQTGVSDNVLLMKNTLPVSESQLVNETQTLRLTSATGGNPPPGQPPFPTEDPNGGADSSSFQPLPSEKPLWWEDFIWSECRGNGPFLEGLARQLVEEFKVQNESIVPISRGDILLRIKQMARLHYHALWKSCTRAEQYALYDISQDGLVNARNLVVIRALVEKGLLRYDGTIRMLNRSFKYYILTHIQPEEGLKIEREVMAHGAWQEFKTPLLIVIFAILAFISLAQRETFNQIITVATSLTVIIPLAMKMFGFFSFGSKTPSSE